MAWRRYGYVRAGRYSEGIRERIVTSTIDVEGNLVIEDMVERRRGG
jgi:hypothetical protein